MPSLNARQRTSAIEEMIETAERIAEEERLAEEQRLEDEQLAEEARLEELKAWADEHGVDGSLDELEGKYQAKQEARKELTNRQEIFNDMPLAFKFLDQYIDGIAIDAIDTTVQFRNLDELQSLESLLLHPSWIINRFEEDIVDMIEFRLVNREANSSGIHMSSGIMQIVKFNNFDDVDGLEEYIEEWNNRGRVYFTVQSDDYVFFIHSRRFDQDNVTQIIENLSE